MKVFRKLFLCYHFINQYQEGYFNIAVFKSIKLAYSTKILSTESIKPNLNKLRYDVRNSVMIKALEYRDMLKANLPLKFQRIINCSNGNPQALWQHPNTFFREVISLSNCPKLLNDGYLYDNTDVVERARKILSEISGGVGGYSLPPGLTFIRKEIADFTERRDGFKNSYHNIYITNGASNGIINFLSLLISNPTEVALIPNPCFPLYKSAINLMNGSYRKYDISTTPDQTIDLKSLQLKVDKEKAEGRKVKVLMVTNPGNPIGYLLSHKEVKEITEFCQKENIFILADEVLQDYAYNGKVFTSFRQVANEIGSKEIQLCSVHSVSKGLYGECGRRGGYIDLHNVPEEIHDLLYKILSFEFCPNMGGQIALSCYCNPPRKNDDSFEDNEMEYGHIYRALQRKAKLVNKIISHLDGIEFTPISGGLFTFPRISIPQKAVMEARDKGLTPDTFYSLELLSKTGIVVQPGYIYKDKEDEKYNIRISILPSEQDIENMLPKFMDFHKEFLKSYS